MTASRSARSPRLKLDISNELMKEAIQKDSSHCMIAEAVLTAFPEAKKISVDLATIRFTDNKKRLRYTYLTPRIAQVALVNFDQGRLPEPFAFELKGAQVTKSGSNKPKNRSKATPAQEIALSKARLVLRRKDGHVAERVGGQTPPLQRGKDDLPFTRRRAFGLRGLEL